MKLQLILVAILVATPMVQAEIYKYSDEHGNVVLTDTPPAQNADAESVDIQSLDGNTVNLSTSQHRKNDKYYDQRDQRQAKEEAQNAREANLAQQQQARKGAVRKAELDLEEAKEIKSGDMMPLPSGGIRYTDQYKQRVKNAEDALMRAKAKK